MGDLKDTDLRLAQGQPSRTALSAAMYRAAHQLVDKPPVFEDPLALKIIGDDAEKVLRAGSERWTSPNAASFRGMIAARSRYSDDCFVEAFKQGIRQYVSLGAGLDTFAYRIKLKGLSIFEVDHPATQTWKSLSLEQNNITIPENLTYVPVDFENETLKEGLGRTGFNFSERAFFSWLGVTPYLTLDAVIGTLAFVAKQMPRGSEIVFDFAVPPSDDPYLKARQETLVARVGSIGEPIKSIFIATELEKSVKSLGFSSAEALDFNRLNELYFKKRADGLKLQSGHLMRARI